MLQTFQAPKRGAVVVGVDKTGGLTPLRAAASGATAIQGWLNDEGFVVQRLGDDDQDVVTIGAVKDAIRSFVNPGTYEQLVVYFAGHGYLRGTSEIWLLSHAPDDPDEAIDLTVSVELARSCGIPSVVFISDACRSNPASVAAARVRGSSIFPNRMNQSADVEVDRFFATAPGDPALELLVTATSQNYAGLFTEILQSVHVNPDDELVRVVSYMGAMKRVIPSRKLKETLPKRVNETAQARSIRLNQKPQFQLECGDETFIGAAIYNGIISKSAAASAHSAQPQ